jgi:hypothetical protein
MENPFFNFLHFFFYFQVEVHNWISAEDVDFEVIGEKKKRKPEEIFR